MKLTTHYIFSTGIITAIDVYFTAFYKAFLIALAISLLANAIIDKFGHKRRYTKYGKIPVRTPVTHTFSRSILWGLFASMIMIIPFYMESYISIIGIIMLSGLVVGPTHMFLDSFTGAGIFIKKRNRWKRLSILHLKYNNKVANGIAVFSGIALLLISFIDYNLIFIWLHYLVNSFYQV